MDGAADGKWWWLAMIDGGKWGGGRQQMVADIGERCDRRLQAVAADGGDRVDDGK